MTSEEGYPDRLSMIVVVLLWLAFLTVSLLKNIFK